MRNKLLIILMLLFAVPCYAGVNDGAGSEWVVDTLRFTDTGEVNWTNIENLTDGSINWQDFPTFTDNYYLRADGTGVAFEGNIRWLAFNLVAKATANATATNIAGDFVSPIAGTILQSDSTPFYLYATNSTAGINTGTGLVVDISIGGTSIMTTNKLDFDTTEKTTTTAATPPDLTTTTVAVGDIITIDINSIHDGTAAKGLIVYLAIRED